MGLKPRQWIILLTFYTVYLMFVRFVQYLQNVLFKKPLKFTYIIQGACVFYHIEHNAETERRANELQARIDINELLVAFTSPDDIHIQKDILNRLSSYCNKPVTDYKEDDFVNPYQWTFYHSVFFAFIVCSTLGYGNITPSGTVGRYFMIAYALIGMPVNMILFAYLGEYFGSFFIKVYRKYKAYEFARHMHANENYKPARWSMITKITLSLLLPALVILIFLPSAIFTYFEGWDYSISVYYSFVTLLTIGFGDFVPTFQPQQEATFGIYFVFYQIFVLVWFVFGLSYILMLIGFIARGMQSKKISRFEKQLAENIKITHNRIWTEVSKDVGYLRRILNEVYIMRVRPVFTEPTDVQLNYRQNRSQSCPNLTIFDSNSSPVPRRKRARSANFFSDDKYTAEELEQRPLQLQSRHSESNLMRIDRDKTFNQNGILDNTGEILAQVVFALNDFNSTKEEPATGGGIDLFSDENILEDEWSIVTAPSEQPNQKMPKKLRSRAKSLHPQISRISNEETNTPQFTWSGNNNDIQDYINAQVKNEKKGPKIMPKKDPNGVLTPNIEKEKNVDSNVGRRKSVFNAFNNIFKRRNTMHVPNVEAPPDEQIEKPSTPSVKISPAPLGRRTSVKMDMMKMPLHLSGESKRRLSILSNQSVNSEHVLETTTIADLIRAIESAHTKNMLGPVQMANSRTNRRMSMAAPQMGRRGSVSFSSPLETPPSAGSNHLRPRRPSLVMPRNRILTTVRQNSTPHRFNVTPVVDSPITPSSAMSLSPVIQRRLRRFSAVPSTTIMPSRRPSSSLHATPLALRRTQFKQTISPLAMPPTLAETPTKNTK